MSVISNQGIRKDSCEDGGTGMNAVSAGSLFPLLRSSDSRSFRAISARIFRFECIWILLLSCILTTTPSNARTIRVPAALPTIQEAINAASSGDTIVVYPGTYYENILFRGKNVVVTSRFYETGDLAFIRQTIINGSRPAHSDTGSCILIIGGEDSTAVLQGFTITGGT